MQRLLRYLFAQPQYRVQNGTRIDEPILRKVQVRRRRICRLSLVVQTAEPEEESELSENLDGEAIKERQWLH